MAGLAGLLIPRLVLMQRKKIDPGIRMLDEGWKQESEGKYSAAMKSYGRAEQYYRGKPKYRAQLAKAVFLQALLYKRLKKYDKAEERLFESTELCLAINDEESLGHAYIKIGETYEEQKQYKKASGYYGKAAELFKKMGRKKHTAYAYYHAAMSAASAGQRKAAMENFKTALNRYRSLEELDTLADILIEAGGVMWDIGAKEEAVNVLREAARYLKKTGPKEKAAALNERLESLTKEPPSMRR
jgi:tetratricopeptide (TPR) repeat protein